MKWSSLGLRGSGQSTETIVVRSSTRIIQYTVCTYLTDPTSPVLFLLLSRVCMIIPNDIYNPCCVYLRLHSYIV